MKLNKGFTLIELLIVIGVLAILATGLLAAVDPFEQLKKARDANNRNAAIETLNALTRYYATHGFLPWNTTQADCVKAVFDPLRAVEAGYPHKVVKMANSGSVADYNADVNACITETLLADGELKSEFFTGLAATIYMASGSTTKAIVCFAPEGKALKNDTNSTAFVVSTDTVSARTPATDCSSETCVACYE